MDKKKERIFRDFSIPVDDYSTEPTKREAIIQMFYITYDIIALLNSRSHKEFISLTEITDYCNSFGGDTFNDNCIWCVCKSIPFSLIKTNDTIGFWGLKI